MLQEGETQLDFASLVKPILELGATGVQTALLLYLIAYLLPKIQEQARQDIKDKDDKVRADQREAWEAVSKLRDTLERTLDALKK